MAAVDGSTALIFWETDEHADSIVHFGPTIDYDSIETDKARGKQHEILLTNLDPGTYHYKVLSRDLSGNWIESSDNVFIIGSTLPTSSPLTLLIGVLMISVFLFFRLNRIR